MTRVESEPLAPKKEGEVESTETLTQKDSETIKLKKIEGILDMKKEDRGAANEENKQEVLSQMQGLREFCETSRDQFKLNSEGFKWFEKEIKKIDQMSGAMDKYQYQSKSKVLYKDKFGKDLSVNQKNLINMNEVELKLNKAYVAYKKKLDQFSQSEDFKSEDAELKRDADIVVDNLSDLTTPQGIEESQKEVLEGKADDMSLEVSDADGQISPITEEELPPMAEVLDEEPSSVAETASLPETPKSTGENSDIQKVLTPAEKRKRNMGLNAKGRRIRTQEREGYEPRMGVLVPEKKTQKSNPERTRLSDKSDVEKMKKARRSADKGYQEKGDVVERVLPKSEQRQIDEIEKIKKLLTLKEKEATLENLQEELRGAQERGDNVRDIKKRVGLLEAMVKEGRRIAEERQRIKNFKPGFIHKAMVLLAGADDKVHAFFDSTWIGRHTLGSDSPLNFFPKSEFNKDDKRWHLAKKEKQNK